MKRSVLPALIVLFAAAGAFAAPVTYTVDPAQSSITLQATTATLAGGPQSAGADTDAYAGTISVDLTGSTLSFSGGSSVVAQPNPAGPFTPTVGTAGTAGTVDNYGFVTDLSGLGYGDAYAAFRDLVLDIPSGSATVGGSAAGLMFSLTTGVADGYSSLVGAGSIDLVGKSATNGSAGNVTLSTNGLIETLTIPVSMTFDTSAQGIPGTAQITGQLVATRVIPEPITLSLLGLGGLALLRRRRG